MDGATNAGLASAYQKMKLSFERPIFWSTVAFVASICAIVGISFHFATTPNGDTTFTIDYMLTAFVSRLPFYLPLVWLAVFTSARRSEYSRLQQEYAHKEALATSYDSYKKQIEELDGDKDEIRQLLLSKAIESIAYNASETLDKKHGDKHPLQEFASTASSAVKRGGSPQG